MQTPTPLHRAVPAARTIDLVTTHSQDEVLVYDQQSHHIHHLNAQAAAVWRLCDGRRTVDHISVASRLDETAVRLALGALADAHLLEGDLQAGLRNTTSRRSFLKKATAAGAVALPTIVSISSPAAAQSTSPSNPCEGTLTTVDQCSSIGQPCWTGVPGTGNCGSCKQSNGSKWVCSS